MAVVVDNPVEEIFKIWGAAIESEVGKGNYSMDSSSLIAKAPFARLIMLGNPTSGTDTEGNEVATKISFQTESFASGQRPLTKVYKIDSASHAAMVGMGFQRTYGPELIENADQKIKRIVSRYSRIYTGQL